MSALWQRVVAWRTSSVGLTGTAVAVYLFAQLGCRWPEWHEWMAVIVPGLLGVLLKDRA